MKRYFIFPLLALIIVSIMGCSEKSAQAPETPTPEVTLVPALTPSPAHPPQSSPSPLVKFAIENNISENLALKLENCLGENLSENIIEFIQILSKFNSDHVPVDISDLVGENYRIKLSESLQNKIVDSIASDGYISGEEIEAIEFTLSLPKETQRWYIEEIGLDKKNSRIPKLLEEHQRCRF